MSIRIGTFNVENLFNRPRAMNQKTWAQGQPMLDAAHELNDLFQLLARTRNRVIPNLPSAAWGGW